MNRLLSLIVLATVLSAVIAYYPEDKTKWGKLTCRPRGIYTPDDALTAELQACGSEDCLFQCQSKAFGVLKEDGTTSIGIYYEFIDAVFPEEHKKLGKDFFGECFHKFGDFIDIKDEKCVMSKKFDECLWRILPLLTCDYAHPPPK